ncbi:hypothetical protein [Bifidobacterium longum]|uniref:hypothetical protein n=1 Tax=Bifidobacterium longum TaxID=216816 RepID=UPI003EB9001F|nr:hypothetical protein [Bifidobacterium longum]
MSKSSRDKPEYVLRRYHGARWHAIETFNICAQDDPNYDQQVSACLHAGMSIELFIKARLAKESPALLANKNEDTSLFLRAANRNDDSAEATLINADINKLLLPGIQLLRPETDIGDSSICLDNPRFLLKTRNIAAHAHYAFCTIPQLRERFSNWIHFVMDSTRRPELRDLLDEPSQAKYEEWSNITDKKVSDIILQARNNNFTGKRKDPNYSPYNQFMKTFDALIKGNTTADKLSFAIYSCPSCTHTAIVMHAEYGWHTEWAGEDNSSRSYLFDDTRETLHCPFCQLILETNEWNYYSENKKSTPIIAWIRQEAISNAWYDEIKEQVVKSHPHTNKQQGNA